MSDKPKTAGNRYAVEYKVPVFAYIEFDDDNEFRITKVVVNDEDTGTPVHVEYDGGEDVNDPEERDAVTEAIDGPDADWPGWEFGW